MQALNVYNRDKLQEIEQVFTLVYEFKLQPTSAQIATFEEWLEQCRRVYNYALCERKHWVNSRKCPVNACSIKSEYIIPASQPAPTYNSQAVALTQAFLDILQACCFKRGVYFQKVPANGTSQTCPKCLKETGKKKLSKRVHNCQHCGYTCDRDVAAAQVVEIRGLLALNFDRLNCREVEGEAVGHTVVRDVACYVSTKGKGHVHRRR